MSGLNDRPSAERVHIGFFGLRNAGKSSVVNAVTGQKLSLVSDVKGTTTDPVQKAMELLPLGPVVIIDTPGIDDEGELGEMRVRRAKQTLEKTDIAVVVVDSVKGMQSADIELENIFKEKNIPYIIAMNKCDLAAAVPAENEAEKSAPEAAPAQTIQPAAAPAAPTNAAKGRAASHPASGTAPYHTAAPVVPNGDPTAAATYSSRAASHPASGTAPNHTGAVINISAATGKNINALKDLIAALAAAAPKNEKQLISDLIAPGDIVILVTPIDESAPKGRLILPQQQTIRGILDSGAINIVVKETELAAALAALKQKPKMVITDSQAFGKVSTIVPDDILLTSFSILFARYKGELEEAVKGAAALDRLKDGDKVLISEGCTHHRQCNDIGTVKMPGWIENYTGKKLEFEFTSGREFPEDLSEYALIVHCGACMLTEREMKSRISHSRSSSVPITNYGIAIAQMHGILKRSLSPFPALAEELR